METPAPLNALENEISIQKPIEDPDELIINEDAILPTMPESQLLLSNNPSASSTPQPKNSSLKKFVDKTTVTPIQWTPEASQMELNILRNEYYELHGKLQRCLEIEHRSMEYISVLKRRSRNVEELIDRVRDVEGVNRRLKRDLEYEYDEAISQNKRIEFWQRKSEDLKEERDDITLECDQMKKRLEKMEEERLEFERMTDVTFRKKLEEEVEKIEKFYKLKSVEDGLCSSCFSYKITDQPSLIGNSPPNVSMDSRTILMNPSHPSFKKMSSMTPQELREISKDVNNTDVILPARIVKLDERVEFTYYAAPMNPIIERKPVKTKSAFVVNDVPKKRVKKEDKPIKPGGSTTTDKYSGSK